ncbi:MAG: Gfo/Idh/MocA family oxidoreductase [Armatimonadetes bacterium]|nr:Gfo/Idh/MocA family oxidoreductase [Armatimonadota bacterium]
MDPVRLAVIGCGNQCTVSLMPGLPFIPEFDLVAVCDLKEDLARRNARLFGARGWYTDAARMLADEAPEAVMVVGPPQMHEELGSAAFQAGCHVFTEKPSSPTIAGARRLAAAGLAAGKLGQIGHMMRHAESVRAAWELSHREEFGRILSVESKYTTWPTASIPPGHGWGEPDEDWTYMLVQGGHPTDLMRHFLGPIVRVMARRAHGAGNYKVYQVTVEGAGGEVGFLNLQDCYGGWSTRLEVTGDRGGSLTIDDLDTVRYRRDDPSLKPPGGGMCWTAGEWTPHFTTKMGVRAGYQNQLQAFARSIRAGTPAFPSLADGWRNLVVAEAIVESCRTGRAVEVAQETV